MQQKEPATHQLPLSVDAQLLDLNVRLLNNHDEMIYDKRNPLGPLRTSCLPATLKIYGVGLGTGSDTVT